MIKTILVPLTGVDAGATLLESAVRLGRRFEAHVDVLLIRRDPAESLRYLTRGLSVTDPMKRQVIDAAAKAADEIAEKARAEFEAYCAANRIPIVAEPPGPGPVTASWREAVGREGTVVARRGRVADLTVVLQPAEEAPPPLILEAALMRTGKPVLVVPPGPPQPFDSRVAIGWDGSAEAASAVTGALPILSDAEEVVVLLTDETARPYATAADLVRYLASHRVAASMRRFDPGSRSVGDALLAEAEGLRIDLLVLGGYGHSRTRELILGGVTRQVLAAGTIPVLMAH